MALYCVTLRGVLEMVGERRLFLRLATFFICSTTIEEYI